MSAAEQLRARARAIADRDRPPAPERAAGPEPAPERGPVRQTVDVSAERHDELATWRIETALALGRRPGRSNAVGLTVQELLVAVVDVLLDDPSVARRVRAHLEMGGGS